MKPLGIAFAAIAIAVVLYKLSYPTYTCRYRMTVNVEVDGKLRSGSSVIEFQISKQMRFLPDVNPIKFDAVGEAVYVDLDGQRGLMALLKSGTNATDGNFPLRVVPAHFKLDMDRQLASLPGLRGKWELPANELPTLVTFSDANRSATLRIVHPDQLEQAFGAGVHWRGIVIEMTTDPVTHGLESRLPFLVSEKNALRRAYQNPFKFIPEYFAFVRD